MPAQRGVCLADKRGRLRAGLLPAGAGHRNPLLLLFRSQADKGRPALAGTVVLQLPEEARRDPRFDMFNAGMQRSILELVEHPPAKPPVVIAVGSLSPSWRASQARPSATRAVPPDPLAAGMMHYTAGVYDPLLMATIRNGRRFDANQNVVTTAGGTAYTWDFDDRLIKVQAPDGTVVEHDYDHDGNRIETRVTPPGGETKVTRYLIDPSGLVPQVVAETDGNGNLNALYTRTSEGELLSASRPDGTGGWPTRHVHTDALSSVRRLTDERGQVTDTYTYSAHGELISRTGTDPQPYRFAGEAFEPVSGLQYHRARWFDPKIGRFLSQDPWGGDPEQPATLHRYFYAANDPVNRRDPTGEFFDSGSQLTAALGANTIRATSTITFGKVLAAVGLAGVAGGQILGPLAALHEMKERAVPTDLYAFGNTSGPRAPRASEDFGLASESDNVSPELPPLPKGASAFGDPMLAPLTGHYWRVSRGILLPPGLAVVPDGSDFLPGSTRPPSHHTIYPTVTMPFQTFGSLFLGQIPWVYEGRKR
jgi:RHS repeat-associated protein